MMPVQIFKKSICKSCEHVMIRTIQPLTEDYKSYLEEVFEIDTDITDCIIEQFKCLITNEDLDGIISDCNRYAPAPTQKLIREYNF